jgi:type IV secretory pathway TraG/TraD family ATPase VirD4
MADQRTISVSLIITSSGVCKAYMVFLSIYAHIAVAKGVYGSAFRARSVYETAAFVVVCMIDSDI